MSVDINVLKVKSLRKHTIPKQEDHECKKCQDYLSSLMELFKHVVKKENVMLKVEYKMEHKTKNRVQWFKEDS